MRPSLSTLMPLAAKWSATSAATLLFTACGLMKVNAECDLQARATSRSARRFSNAAPGSACDSATFCGSLASCSIRCKQVRASRSSSTSKSGSCWPSKLTMGLVHQYSTVGNGTPAERTALPKKSSATFTPIQFMRSASASKGLAEAWSTLSPVSGHRSRPKAFHSSWNTLRSDPASAVRGSVAPTIFPRKCCQDIRLGSHSASM
mmetsp:Transcript_92813/g.215692  ORF Transcript_92813/g.215692 Transcript_92813/m.215692 type:complete len:205 (+) Transcript_92813:927-1541(+)